MGETRQNTRPRAGLHIADALGLPWGAAAWICVMRAPIKWDLEGRFSRWVVQDTSLAPGTPDEPCHGSDPHTPSQPWRERCARSVDRQVAVAEGWPSRDREPTKGTQLSVSVRHSDSGGRALCRYETKSGCAPSSSLLPVSHPGSYLISCQ